MQTDAPLQEKTHAELLSIIASQSETITNQKQTISQLLEQIRLNRYQRFGKKSEKDADGAEQLSLFDEAEVPENVEEIEQADEEITVATHQRKKGRKALPKTLERVEKVYDLTKEEKQCDCGCELTCIGDERSEQLEFIPAKTFVTVHVRKKYACKGCEQTVRQAKLPAQPIPKSIASPSLLAHIAVAKFEDHLPLYRQEKILQRAGIDIARATLSQWVIRTADVLKPLVNLLQSTIIEYDVAFSDESPVQVLREPGRKPEQKSYMWLFGGGPPDKFSFVYRYSPSRAHDVPLSFFGDFKGYLHCDGFSAYDTLATKSGLTLIGCWYHVRRKFVEAEKVSSKAGLAKQAIKIIKKLSVIEKDIKNAKLNDEQAFNARQCRAKPLLNEMKAWCSAHATRVPKESLIGKAIHYTLAQWPKLKNYLQDGRLEISNNRTERGIKPFATGRKNWLFACSVDGADAAAIIYSLIETCKAHKVDSYDYLRFVLEKLPLARSLEDVEKLLPFNCKDLLCKNA